MTLESILERAKTSKKHNWRIYGYFKGQIQTLNLPSKEYEDAIQKLCEVLEV
jgi:hypothetical protein